LFKSLQLVYVVGAFGAAVIAGGDGVVAHHWVVECFSSLEVASDVQQQKNMAALQIRWPVVWAKAQRLLALSGIDDYCRKPQAIRRAGGPYRPLAGQLRQCATG
jgi:hypothetical protein